MMWNLRLAALPFDENCAWGKFFLVQKSLVFMGLPAINSLIRSKKLEPGVASAFGLCYNNQVSRERYCRQRMRGKL